MQDANEEIDEVRPHSLERLSAENCGVNSSSLSFLTALAAIKTPRTKDRGGPLGVSPLVEITIPSEESSQMSLGQKAKRPTD